MNVQKAKQRFYRPDEYDNDGAFLKMILDAVDPQSRVLDAGAGAGDMFEYDLKNRVEEIVGVDLDPRVESNSQLHRGVVTDLTSIPVEDNYFDLVFSRYVLEHIESPQMFLKEIARILKPGGKFLFLTPNKWHYVSLASRLTPKGFHDWYNRMRGRDDEDTFPTLYRLNSSACVRRQMAAAGFVKKQLMFRECCPNYLTFSLPSFLLGVAYERVVNSCDLLAGMRVNILGWYRKADRAGRLKSN